jgi:hypothetical protein
MKCLMDNLINSMFATIYILVSLIITTPPAKAGEVKTIVKNGIALNANPVYGYKNGLIKVSQYFVSNYNDPEQQWEVIPVGGGKSILRNIQFDKCLNTYQISVGSTPNLYNCDSNDDDMKVILNDNIITDPRFGLILNLGDANDTAVVWKQSNIIRSSYSSHEYPRNGNSYTGPKLGSTEGFNGPKYVIVKGKKGINTNCTRYTDSVKWIYRDMYTDPATGQKVFKWSLNIVPSECGRTSRNPTNWKSWEEVVSKAPYNNEENSVAWDKTWNTSQYWSMYNQYVCHTDFASHKGKYDYNLEPDRVDAGYWGNSNPSTQCNGKFN